MPSELTDEQILEGYRNSTHWKLTSREISTKCPGFRGVADAAADAQAKTDAARIEELEARIAELEMILDMIRYQTEDLAFCLYTLLEYAEIRIVPSEWACKSARTTLKIYDKKVNHDTNKNYKSGYRPKAEEG